MQNQTLAEELRTPQYGNLLRLDGKTFVVIGAGQGIGQQAAHALAQMGAKVVCVGRGREATEAVANEVGGVACVADATRREDVQRIFAETLAACGQVNGLVDILGEARMLDLEDITDEDWDWQFNIVLRHVFLTAQIGLPLIAKSGGGAAVYVSSVSAQNSSRKQVAYSAAKAGLEHFVRTTAVEYGPRQVRVNSVVPGLVRTPRIVKNFKADSIERIASVYPMGRTAVPSDIAAAILFLASDLSRHMTGQNVMVDGGVSLRSPIDLAGGNLLR